MIIDEYALDSLFQREYKNGRGGESTTDWSQQGFRAVFGVWDYEAAYIWNHLDIDEEKRTYDIEGWLPKHLLDCLFFMKGCYRQRQAAIFCGRDEKSLRKWNWKIATAIASQDWIHFENRYNCNNGLECLITVDGTDFRIQEPTPFDPRWCSHKFKGPGVRYEVGVCIQTGEIVWTNGPFACAEWSDIRIARSALIYELDEDKKALADEGYNNSGVFFETPTGHNNFDQRMKAKAKVRHECINRRFKQWGILQQRVRSNVEQHGVIFMAIANITNMQLMGEGWWTGDIFYKDVWEGAEEPHIDWGNYDCANE